MSKFGGTKVSESKFGGTAVEVGSPARANEFLNQGFQLSQYEPWQMRRYVDPETGISVELPLTIEPIDPSLYRKPERTVANSLGSFIERSKAVAKALPEFTTAALVSEGLRPVARLQDMTPSQLTSYNKNVSEASKQIEQTQIFIDLRKSMLPNIKSSEEFAQRYRGSKSQSLLESAKQGNWSQFGSDLHDVMALEGWNFASIMALSVANPWLGLSYAGTSSAVDRYAQGISDGEAPHEAMSAGVAYGAAEIGFEWAGSVGMISGAARRRAKGEVLEGFGKRTLEFAREPSTEIATQITQNLVDGRPWYEGVPEAGLVGIGFGGGITAMTLGDSNRIRQQNTNDQIDAMVKDGNLTQKEADAAKMDISDPEKGAAVEDAESDKFTPREEAVDPLDGSDRIVTPIEIEDAVLAEEAASLGLVPEALSDYGAEAKAAGVEVEGLGKTYTLSTPDGRLTVTYEEGKGSLTEQFNAQAEKQGIDTAQYKPQEAAKPAAVTEGRIVGISKDQNNQWRQMMDQQNLAPPDRKRQEAAIEGALEKGLANKVDELMDSKKPLTDEEVGAFLIRKAELSNEIESIQTKMEEASQANDSEKLAELGEQLNEKIEFGVRLTEAAAKRATITAQGLAAMNMMMDKKTFDLVNVNLLAETTKGEKLTEEESSALKEKSEELKSVEKDLKKLADGKIDERDAIIDEVERAHRRLRKPNRKKADKNEDVKLIKKRQDAIFSVIDEINNGRVEGEQIKKVSQPDSEGYLEMLTNLKSELSELRKTRSLEGQISQMEQDIESGDISKYDTQSESFKEAEHTMLLRARKIALQKEINRQIADLKPRTIGRTASDVWDIFRNLKLTADAGHLLRQGGVVMSNPKMWKGDVQTFYSESLKALLKENADVLDATIMSQKNYHRWKLAGLAFIEEGQQLDAREEILMNGVLGRAPLGIGKAQRAFGRMQISGTNLLRMLAAESYAGDVDNMTLQEMRDIATAINILTGRGATVKDPKVNKVLNKILTSPSFTASRFQAPFLLAHRGTDGKLLWENKKLRNRVLQDYAWFVGTRMALMGLIAAALPEAEIGDDPEHWTYGRLIVNVGGGKSRVYDPWAGIVSAYRALFPITKGDSGGALKKVFEGRKHPSLSSLEEVAFGKTFYGEDIDRRTAALKAFLPISIDGVREAIKEDTGVLDLLASVSTDVMGIGSTLVDTRKLRESRKALD